MDKTDEMLQLLDADHVIHVADAGISAEAAPDGRYLGHTRWTNLRIAGFVLVLVT